LAEIGPHYDSLNEGVMRAVQIAAALGSVRRRCAFVSQEGLLPPLRSGAIMKLG
jgi:hypothetical protein